MGYDEQEDKEDEEKQVPGGGAVGRYKGAPTSKIGMWRWGAKVPEAMGIKSFW